jgi:hypothetical protein
MSGGTEYALRLREVEAERDRLAAEVERRRESFGKLAGLLARKQAWARRWKRAAKENRGAFGEMRGMWIAACDYAGALLRQARRRSSAPCPHGCQGWCARCQASAVNPAAEDRSPVLVHACGPDCKGESHDAIRGAGRP